MFTFQFKLNLYLDVSIQIWKYFNVYIEIEHILAVKLNLNDEYMKTWF